MCCDLYSRNESRGFSILRGSLRFLVLGTRRFHLDLSCPFSFMLCATNAKKWASS